MPSAIRPRSTTSKRRATSGPAPAQFHKAAATRRCKHVLTVAPWPKPEETLPVEVEFDDPTKGMSLPEPPAPNQVRREQVRKKAVTPGPGTGKASEIPAAATGGENLPSVPPKPPEPKRARRSANGSAQMLIKRSISPDGRIDSVSVEFSMPVSDVSNGEIKDKALKTLQLQKGNCEHVPEAQRREGTGQRRSNSRARATGEPEQRGGKPVFARTIDIGKINGKWGERLCINVPATAAAGSSAPPTSSPCRSREPDTT